MDMSDHQSQPAYTDNLSIPTGTEFPRMTLRCRSRHERSDEIRANQSGVPTFWIPRWPVEVAGVQRRHHERKLQRQVVGAAHQVPGNRAPGWTLGGGLWPRREVPHSRKRPISQVGAWWVSGESKYHREKCPALSAISLICLEPRPCLWPNSMAVSLPNLHQMWTILLNSLIRRDRFCWVQVTWTLPT